MWALLFAALHIYWALGGAAGLASSAGVELATSRPLRFVLVGLWAVALLLVGAAAVGLLVARRRPAPGLTGRLAVPLGWLVGLLLLLRGISVEVVLMTGALGIADNVGEPETHWSLVIWNPWFVVGGLFFVLASSQVRRGQSGGALGGNLESRPR